MISGMCTNRQSPIVFGLFGFGKRLFNTNFVSPETKQTDFLKTFLPARVLHAACIVFLFCFSFRTYAGGDSLALPGFDDKRIRAIEETISEMSEPELILLIDSLFNEENIPKPLIEKIQVQAEFIRSLQPKNKFDEGFSLYPANRFYGVWDTRHIFPYSDSLYKADTTVVLDLSEMVSGAFVFPFEGPVTSKFGWRDSAMHRGIDIDLARGDTVKSAFDGMVRFAGKQGGYGNVIIVRHYNGLETVYAHLWKIKVRPGDIVLGGQTLGLGGTTGHSTGTHLHFEMRFRGVAINPMYFIDAKTNRLLAGHFELKRTRNGYAAYPYEEEYYTVVKGDRIEEIARRYGITVRRLWALNEMQGRYRLKSGERLRVRELPAQVAKF
ncbi:MAG: M24/M37 family peptidase [Bacteroidetes bacterium]|nr:MAG: M24/M37 family peptidase [Bacteroidota bacterium]